MTQSEQISAMIDKTELRDGELAIIVKGAQSGLKLLGVARDHDDAEVIGALSGFSFSRVSVAEIKSTGQKFFTLH